MEDLSFTFKDFALRCGEIALNWRLKSWAIFKFLR